MNKLSNKHELLREKCPVWKKKKKEPSLHLNNLVTCFRLKLRQEHPEEVTGWERVKEVNQVRVTQVYLKPKWLDNTPEPLQFE